MSHGFVACEGTFSRRRKRRRFLISLNKWLSRVAHRLLNFVPFILSVWAPTSEAPRRSGHFLSRFVPQLGRRHRTITDRHFSAVNARKPGPYFRSTLQILPHYFCRKAGTSKNWRKNEQRGHAVLLHWALLQGRSVRLNIASGYEGKTWFNGWQL